MYILYLAVFGESVLNVDGEKESAGSDLQLSLTNVRLPCDILQAIDVIVHQYLQSGLLSLGVSVGDDVID